MYYRIKMLREKNNMSKKEISEKLEVSEKIYSEYENGSKKIPVNILSKLARIYNTSIDYIIEDTNLFLPHKKTLK